MISQTCELELWMHTAWCVQTVGLGWQREVLRKPGTLPMAVGSPVAWVLVVHFCVPVASFRVQMTSFMRVKLLFKKVERNSPLRR